MKTLTVFLACFCICIASFSQYKIDKHRYDYKSYTQEENDPYNPSSAGMASCFIPGLGQMLSGETRRGIGFLNGCIGSTVISVVGGTTFATAIPASEQYPIDEGQMWLGFVTATTALAGIITIYICSIVDAVRVAKVNNMAWRNRSLTSLDFSIQPFIYHTLSSAGTLIHGGISIGICF